MTRWLREWGKGGASLASSVWLVGVLTLPLCSCDGYMFFVMNSTGETCSASDRVQCHDPFMCLEGRCMLGCAWSGHCVFDQRTCVGPVQGALPGVCTWACASSADCPLGLSCSPGRGDEAYCLPPSIIDSGSSMGIARLDDGNAPFGWSMAVFECRGVCHPGANVAIACHDCGSVEGSSVLGAMDPYTLDELADDWGYYGAGTECPAINFSCPASGTYLLFTGDSDNVSTKYRCDVSCP